MDADDKPSVRYHYLVVYTFSGGGNGNCLVSLGEPISSIHHIREIEQEINEDTGHPKAVISNYLLLREGE